MRLSSKLFRMVMVFFCLSPSTECWKPIVGHSTTYSLHQSHPGYGSQSHSINTLGGIDIPLEFTGSDVTLPTIVATDTIGLDDIFGYKYQDPRQATDSIFGENSCSVKKYAFDYEGTVQFRNKVPELEQFTICYWMRFTNHSGDHTLLTYSGQEEQREIQFWVSNSKNSSFVSMAIRGQQVYRLNYPLRTRQWHHVCTSWNGKTGEWQVWLMAERIGRGFHNALVSYKIPGNGNLYAGGLSATGVVAHGLHFELTLVQIYRVALSAGKAHRDHKHHHVHHFDHEGRELTSTQAPTPATMKLLPINSPLANGQIPSRVRINFAQQTQALDGINGPDSPLHLAINTNFVNGQFHTNNRLVTQQIVSGTSGPAISSRLSEPIIRAPFFGKRLMNSGSENIRESDNRVIFKRSTVREKQKRLTKRQAKVVNKRDLVFLDDGSIIDDENFKFDGLAEFGGKTFKHDLRIKMSLESKDIEDEIKEYDREPAEEEVKAVMAFCGSCDIEPFQGAIVFAWKNAIATMKNTLLGQSVGRCGNF